MVTLARAESIQFFQVPHVSVGFEPSSTAPWATSRELDQEVEPPGHKPMPIWDPSACKGKVSQLSHCAMPYHDTFWNYAIIICNYEWFLVLGIFVTTTENKLRHLLRSPLWCKSKWKLQPQWADGPSGERGHQEPQDWPESLRKLRPAEPPWPQVSS